MKLNRVRFLFNNNFLLRPFVSFNRIQSVKFNNKNQVRRNTICRPSTFDMRHDQMWTIMHARILQFSRCRSNHAHSTRTHTTNAHRSRSIRDLQSKAKIRARTHSHFKKLWKIFRRLGLALSLRFTINSITSSPSITLAHTPNTSHSYQMSLHI